MVKHIHPATLAADEVAERQTLRAVIRIINRQIRRSEEVWGFQDANGRNALRELKKILARNLRHPGEIRRRLK